MSSANNALTIRVFILCASRPPVLPLPARLGMAGKPQTWLGQGSAAVAGIRGGITPGRTLGACQSRVLGCPACLRPRLRLLLPAQRRLQGRWKLTSASLSAAPLRRRARASAARGEGAASGGYRRGEHRAPGGHRAGGASPAAGGHRASGRAAPLRPAVGAGQAGRGSLPRPRLLSCLQHRGTTLTLHGFYFSLAENSSFSNR